MPGRFLLQLDFDGTVAEGDVSTGILRRFVGEAWPRRVETASAALRQDPHSTALLEAMSGGFARLGGDWQAYLQYAHANHPVRAGLRELVLTTGRLGLPCHVTSCGFEFYIRDYLRRAGVEQQVAIHAGARRADGCGLEYTGPGGHPQLSAFKESWTRHFASLGYRVIYAGDGSSDVAPALLADAVFARDSLLSSLPASYNGSVHTFETLLDVARGLEELAG